MSPCKFLPVYLVSFSHPCSLPSVLALTSFALFPARGLDRSRRYYLVFWPRQLAAGGDDGNRTHDPLLAGQVLSQLSYTPICLNEVSIEFPFGHSKLNNKLKILGVRLLPRRLLSYFAYLRIQSHKLSKL